MIVDIRSIIFEITNRKILNLKKITHFGNEFDARL